MITTFIFSVAGGMLTVLSTGRTDQIAWRFLQLAGMLVLGPIALTLAWWYQKSEGTLGWPFWLGCGAGLAAVGVVLCAPVASRFSKLFKGLAASGGVMGLAAAVVSLLHTIGPVSTPVVSWLAGTSQVIGALMLGSITSAWLLGHAYLTATGMTIDPLRRFSRLLNWTVLLRSSFLPASLILAWILDAGQGELWSALAGQWLALSLRIGLGIVAMAVFAYMVSDCVRLRATQSATGILYFGALFAYVGELAGQYIVLECGWPI